MKCSHRAIDYKHGTGKVVLTPEEQEDMWHLFNLIAVGDHVMSSTYRKVINETASGSTTANRIRITLNIAVERIDYDTMGCTLHLKGKVIEQNEHVKMGAYHTIDLELYKKITLYKSGWDSISYDRLDLACNPSASAEVAAVLMQEGIATVSLITSAMTLVKTKIDTNIPRKRHGHNSAHEKAIEKFYEKILQAMVKHLDLKTLKCVIIASPGFVKDDFMKYLWVQVSRDVSRTEYKEILENKNKFIMAKSSSGFKHSLTEIMNDATVSAKLQDTKASLDTRVLEEFCIALSNDVDRACYGVAATEKACEQHAVERLLITDSLFRTMDFGARRRYVSIVDSVKEFGGESVVFSSLHCSGEYLDKLGGIAAILRFPIPDLDDDDDAHESDSD